jgi:hypothetical protein
MHWAQMIRISIACVAVLAAELGVPNVFAQSKAGDPIAGDPILVDPRIPRVIGPVHREIADSAPDVSVVISASASPGKVGSPVTIHSVYRNTSDHDIYLGNEPEYFEVRDAAGNLAPETEMGCMDHFFSPCHTDEERDTSLMSFARVLPGTRHELDLDLSDDYKLSVPGIYTVVGYICWVSQATDCLRTNTIKITIVR